MPQMIDQPRGQMVGQFVVRLPAIALALRAAACPNRSLSGSRFTVIGMRLRFQ